MRRPSLFVRLTGSPITAILSFVVYLAFIMSWFNGTDGYWPGLLALGGFVRIFLSVRRYRRYKAWLADWNAIANPEPRPKEERHGLRRLVIATAWLLVLGIPALFPRIPGNAHLGPALRLVWLGALAYLAGLVIRRVVCRFAKRRPSKPDATAQTSVVEWMLGRASDSPSRAYAARRLPEHTAGLLDA